MKDWIERKLITLIAYVIAPLVVGFLALCLLVEWAPRLWRKTNETPANPE